MMPLQLNLDENYCNMLVTDSTEILSHEKGTFCWSHPISLKFPFTEFKMGNGMYYLLAAIHQILTAAFLWTKLG